MTFAVKRSMIGLKRTGADTYQSIDEDPKFIYRFWLLRPRYMIVFLASDNNVFNPKIYVDCGGGFDERTAIPLEYVGPSIYVLTVLAPRRVSAIRIDPCSGEASFRYRAESARTKADLECLLAEMQATDVRERTSIYEISIDGKRDKRPKQRRRKWIAKHYASIIELAQRSAPSIAAHPTRSGPIISFVVPLYNTPSQYLDDLLASFQTQEAGSAELILSDDGSSSAETLAWLSRHRDTIGTRIVRGDINRGIAAATNAGIGAAEGDWIGLLDHDDALSPHTVDLIADVIRANPDCQFIYTDELITDESLRAVDYFLKPAYDEVLLSGVNYINHLSCYRRDRLLAIGAMREGYDGSQDYDLVLRYLSGLPQNQIKHLPYPAYCWRRSKAAFSSQFLERATESARKALAERYTRSDSIPTVGEALTASLHRVRLDQQIEQWPRVCVIIPNKDSFSLISRVISDLLIRTDYPSLEIAVIDNGSTDRKVLDLYARTAELNSHFRFEIAYSPFNFSRQVNRGIELTSAEFVLLLNNDVEVLDAAWLREMVSCFRYPETGIVGARLLYPNKRIQHAGVIAGLSGLAGHWFSGLSPTYGGPMGRLHVRQSLSVVTGACMLISRSCLAAVGSFDEKELAVAYNDVDFCLRAVRKGFRVVWTPFATLIHHESASRGSDETRANWARFRREQNVLRQRHCTELFEDRAFNPWYTRDRSDPVPSMLNKLPKAR